MDKTDFTELVRNVSNNKILLPDFQRDFVWTDEDVQKSIVASVLAKMPIGSILLLESKPTDYACIKIGCSLPVDNKSIKGTVSFLLDGQQRITVLTNVFSNVIQNNVKKVSELSSRSLKRRFFLLLPHWNDLWKDKNKADLFGVRHLLFPMERPDSDNPDFLSGEVKDCIEVIPFTATDEKPYNPKMPLDTGLDSFCTGYIDGCLIPLFLAINTGSASKARVEQLRYKTIIEDISNRVSKDIENFAASLPDEEREAFMKELLDDDDQIQQMEEENWSLSVFKGIVEDRAKIWYQDVQSYIDSCLKKMVLNKVVVEEQDRKRAIDIYENMNKGGVTLSTFDLIKARVAIVTKERYTDRIIGCLKNNQKTLYPLDVVPDDIEPFIKPLIKNNEYNASIKTSCYIDSTKEKGLASKYIDAFLDVLSLISYNAAYVPEAYNLQYIKKDKILSLEPEQIDANTEKTIIALDRALYFFQTRCGIRQINEINYSLMLVLVAVIFSNDVWYSDRSVHKLLEGWYWSAIFSGEFDKDQNAMFIRNIQNMINTINMALPRTWIHNMKDSVLTANNFSDKRLLLMQRTKDEERFPKQLLRTYICQFLLSRPYSDMFDGDKMIHVFCREKDDLEAHHIIPLGTATNIGESTKALRNDPSHILNSPLNFVFITKEANQAISDDSLSVYVTKIDNQAKSALHITGYNTDADPEAILSARYDALQGDIKARINQLLQ